MPRNWPITPTFSQNLSWVMDVNRLDVPALAERLGLDLRTVRNMLYGEGFISSQTRCKILNAALVRPDREPGRVTYTWLCDYHRNSPYPPESQRGFDLRSDRSASRPACVVTSYAKAPWWRVLWRRFTARA